MDEEKLPLDCELSDGARYIRQHVEQSYRALWKDRCNIILEVSKALHKHGFIELSDLDVADIGSFLGQKIDETISELEEVIRDLRLDSGQWWVCDACGKIHPDAVSYRINGENTWCEDCWFAVQGGDPIC